MKVKNVLQAIFFLIVLYIFATKGQQVNNLIKTLGGYSLQSVALLQGRENVLGVTA